MGLVVLAPLVFVVVPLVQSIPLPLGLRSALDRNGTALLRENQPVPTPSWPLSLDPPDTRLDAGRAGLALVAFIVAFHLASGKGRRNLVTRTIGAVGVAAVVIGLGHRILGVGKLYGEFTVPIRSLLVGPFVNPNHTAELLEIATFVCLACSFQRPTALNRIGWLVGMLLCAGGAAATLSRGAVFGLSVAAAVFVLMRYFATDAGSGGRRRSSLGWGVLLIGALVLGAGVLGADQLIERFKTDAVSTDVRLRLWRDGLRVLAAHPMGIGRGAFSRVFPIYRSLRWLSHSVRRSREPTAPAPGRLRLVLLAPDRNRARRRSWRIVRHGRRDKIEAALVCGLVAVLVHSTVDFGLETLGVLLPFAAILGTVLGRLPADRGFVACGKMRWAVAALAASALVFGIGSTAHSSSDNFDALLRQPRLPDARHELLIRAQKVHPLDYFYALEEARFEPLQGPRGTPSPRLHALNRAMRLCPACETVHLEVARNLWHFGLRPQALLEWRTAVDLQPSLFTAALGELFSTGAKPQELAAVASSRSDHMLELVDVPSRRAHPRRVRGPRSGRRAGRPRGESLLARAGLQLEQGQSAAAAATAEQARQLGIQDPRLAVLQARLTLATKGAEASMRRSPSSISPRRARRRTCRSRVNASSSWTATRSGRPPSGRWRG